MRETIVVLVVVDLVIALLLYFLGAEHWLINSQVAFISSSLVMLGSIQSYKSMVKQRLVGATSVSAHSTSVSAQDERDTIDKLEDPYDLFDDEKKKEDDKEKSLVEVVKEERANLKKNRRSIIQTTKDAKASFSFYRLGAYGALILGFFYLNSNHLLNLIPYLSFLTLPTIIIVVMLIKQSTKK